LGELRSQKNKLTKRNVNTEKQIEKTLLHGKEGEIEQLIDSIVDNNQVEFAPLIIKAFVHHKPSHIKNALALALSDLDVIETVPIVISDLKKYLQGEDIGTIIYSLDNKSFDNFISDIVYILCESEHNYEAFEMIKLIFDDFEGAISEEQKLKSEKMLKDALAQTSNRERLKYLEWVKNWLSS
jgi:hypothetical protein